MIPTDAIITYTVTVTHPTDPVPNGLITYDDVTREFRVEGSNIDWVKSYDVHVEAFDVLGATTNTKFQFIIEVKDPCKYSTLTID